MSNPHASPTPSPIDAAAKHAEEDIPKGSFGTPSPIGKEGVEEGDDETCTACHGTGYDPVAERRCHCSPVDAAPVAPLVALSSKRIEELERENDSLRAQYEGLDASEIINGYRTRAEAAEARAESLAAEVEERKRGAESMRDTFAIAMSHFREAMDERNTLKNENRYLAAEVVGLNEDLDKMNARSAIDHEKINSLTAENERMRSQLAWAYGEVDNLKGGTVPALEAEILSLTAQVAGLREALTMADHTITSVADNAYRTGLEGTSEWDQITGGKLFVTQDAIRAALASPTEPDGGG